MSDARYELEKLITRHAKAGSSWSIDAWPIGGTHPQRFTVSADWLRDNEPAVERITIQSVPTKERGWEELLAAVAGRLRR
jgi:hypothetical protein